LFLFLSAALLLDVFLKEHNEIIGRENSEINTVYFITDNDEIKFVSNILFIQIFLASLVH